MPVISIDNVGKVSVPDSFMNMNEQEQNAYVDQIRQAVGSGHKSQEEAEAASNKGSLANAAVQSVLHGLPASFAGGAATIGNTIEDRLGTGDVGGIVGGLRKFAANQRQDIAQNYQRPSDVDPSVIHALGQGNFGDALRSAAYTGAENIGTTGAALGTGALAALSAPASIPAAIAAGTLATTQAADSVNEGRRAAGLKADQGLTNADLANAGAQTLANSLPGAGRLVGGLGGALVRMGESGLRSGADSALNATSEAAQGGNVGTVGDVLRNAGDAAIGGAAIHAAAGTGAAGSRAIADAAGRVSDAYRVGPEFRQGVRDLAAGQSQSLPIQNLSPEAQLVSRALDTIPIVSQRRVSEGPGASKRPLQETVGAVRDELQTTLTNTAKGLRDQGLLSKDDHDELKLAIKQAHNQNASTAQTQPGQADAVLQTHLDRVAQMPLDPDIKQQFLHGLGVLDTTSSNKIKKRSQAVYEPAFRGIMSSGTSVLPAILGVTGALHGGSGEALLGAAMGYGGNVLKATAVNRAGRLGAALDELKGNGVPNVLVSGGAKQRYAARKGVQPSITGQSLADMEQEATTQGREAQARVAQVLGSAFTPRPQAQPQAPRPQQTQGPQTAPQQPMPQAPQATQQAPSGAQAGSPFAGIDLSAAGNRYNPGWMGAGPTQALEPNKARLHNFLANLRESGTITPEQHEAFATQDNIGSQLGTLQGIIGELQANGQWEQASSRMPNAQRYAFAGRTAEVKPNGAAQAGPNLDAAGNPIVSQMLYDRQASGNAKALDTAVSKVADNSAESLVIRSGLIDIHNARTRDEKEDILEQLKQALPDRARELHGLALPLLKYGKKGNKS